MTYAYLYMQIRVGVRVQKAYCSYFAASVISCWSNRQLFHLLMAARIFDCHDIFSQDNDKHDDYAYFDKFEMPEANKKQLHRCQTSTTADTGTAAATPTPTTTATTTTTTTTTTTPYCYCHCKYY